MLPNMIASRLRAKELASIIDRFLARAEQEMQRVDELLLRGKITPEDAGQLRRQLRDYATEFRDLLQRILDSQKSVGWERSSEHWVGSYSI